MECVFLDQAKHDLLLAKTNHKLYMSSDLNSASSYMWPKMVSIGLVSREIAERTRLRVGKNISIASRCLWVVQAICGFFGRIQQSTFAQWPSWNSDSYSFFASRWWSEFFVEHIWRATLISSVRVSPVRQLKFLRASQEDRKKKKWKKFQSLHRVFHPRKDSMYWVNTRSARDDGLESGECRPALEMAHVAAKTWWSWRRCCRCKT